MAQQYRYNRYNRNSVLNSAYTTIGQKAAETLGLMQNQDGSFNMQHIKDLEDVTGNIVVTDLSPHVNSLRERRGNLELRIFHGKGWAQPHGSAYASEHHPLHRSPRPQAQHRSAHSGPGELCNPLQGTRERDEQDGGEPG